MNIIFGAVEFWHHRKRAQFQRASENNVIFWGPDVNEVDEFSIISLSEIKPM